MPEIAVTSVELCNSSLPKTTKLRWYRASFAPSFTYNSCVASREVFLYQVLRHGIYCIDKFTQLFTVLASENSVKSV